MRLKQLKLLGCGQVEHLSFSSCRKIHGRQHFFKLFLLLCIQCDSSRHGRVSAHSGGAGSASLFAQARAPARDGASCLHRACSCERQTGEQRRAAASGNSSSSSSGGRRRRRRRRGRGRGGGFSGLGGLDVGNAHGSGARTLGRVLARGRLAPRHRRIGGGGGTRRDGLGSEERRRRTSSRRRGLRRVQLALRTSLAHLSAPRGKHRLLRVARRAGLVFFVLLLFANCAKQKKGRRRKKKKKKK